MSKNTYGLVLVGCLSTLLALGIFRFAYSALLPLLIAAQWLSTDAAIYLSAANLCGYLVGALSANPTNRRFAHTQLIAFATVFGSISLLACAWPQQALWWYVIWRFVAGVTGAWLMVLAPAWVLRQVDGPHKNRASAMVFSGIGLGVLLSALLLPYIPQWGLVWAWIAIGTISLLLSAVVCVLLCRLNSPTFSPTPRISKQSSNTTNTKATILVMLAYGCFGMGYLPHSLFWVDYLARDLGWNLHTVDTQWLLYGLGAASGSLLGFVLVKRLGWLWANLVCFVVYSAAIAMPLFGQNPWWLAWSSFFTGALVPVMVSLSSGCLLVFVGSAHHQRFWGYTTAWFSLCQFGGGLLFSHILTSSHHYPYLFGVGSALLLVGGLLTLLNCWWQQQLTQASCTLNATNSHNKS